MNRVKARLGATIREFLGIVELAEEIYEADFLWETKYDLIFSKNIRGREKELIGISWCDPDTSYEDDVRAYVLALRDKASELKKFLEKE